MKTTATGLSLLAALDNGAYREAIERYESSQPSDDPIETIWRAEIAMYQDKIADARAELNRLPEGLDRDLENRVQIILAELAFWENAFDEAREILGPVIQSTWERGDHQAHLRATLLRARVELRQTNFTEALERLKEPRRLATVLGNDFYAGFIAYCRAFAYYNLGDYKPCGHALAEARHLLGTSEGLRWELTCRTFYAGYLGDLGQYEESLTECDWCEKRALELGLIRQMLYARNNAAATYLLLGRFEEVVQRTADLLTWERSESLIFGEMKGLQLRANALIQLGRYTEAKQAAQELIRLAEMFDSRDFVLDGEVRLAWAGAKEGNPEAVGRLLNLVDSMASIRPDETSQSEVRLYAADALAGSRPDVAAQLYDEARTLESLEENGWLRLMATQVGQALSTGPIRIGPNGELIIDPMHEWPEFESTIETVKRYLVFKAVRESGGNRSEAGRKIGLSRSRLHDLWRQLHGESPRPRRGDVTRV